MYFSQNTVALSALRKKMFYVCFFLLICDNLALKWRNNLLMLVLTCYMSTHSVVTRKCSWTEWTWYSNSLMALANVSSQVGFVAVLSITKRTLKFLAWNDIKLIPQSSTTFKHVLNNKTQFANNENQLKASAHVDRSQSMKSHPCRIFLTISCIYTFSMST